MAKGLGRKALPWLFLAPMLALIALSWIAPLFLTVYLGFTDLSIKNFLAFIRNFFTEKVHITIDNFRRVFMGGDPYISEVFKVTLLYVGSVLLINAGYSLLLSISIAYLVRNEILSMILRVSWLIPRITPGIIYALVWNWFIDPKYGLLNPMLSAIGVPKAWLPSSWLLDKPYSQILMIVVNGYIGASFGMIVYTAAIKSIPPDLINAALVDGASDFQVARNVIIPLLRWPMLFVTAWQTLSLLASYDVILMIWGSGGGGGYAGIARAAGVMVWSLYSYSKAFSEYMYGYASAISLVLVVIGIVLIVVYFKLFGFRRLMEPSRVEV
ncbi:MAG: ABC transporter permease [Desulfurococcales archaeon ex4484_204]|nr:MAG: ABC transporter permease [Desulfurococcales archaeon ex4484_204]